VGWRLGFGCHARFTVPLSWQQCLAVYPEPSRRIAHWGGWIGDWAIIDGEIGGKGINKEDTMRTENRSCVY